jgi:serine/threonine protein phosphatase PrpC
MGHFECNGTDFLLIVCDGVSEGEFSNPEVCQLAAQVLKETKGDAGKACEAVCHRAVETNSKDNISCMIVMMVSGETAREKGERCRGGVAGCGHVLCCLVCISCMRPACVVDPKRSF